MTDQLPRIRVAAYVIRQAVSGPELLVFDHVGLPEAGTQVPAGGVRPGETLADAAIREVAEETGVTGVKMVAELGVSGRPHPDTGLPRRTTYFHLEVEDGPVHGWEHRVATRGEDDGLLFACWFAPLPLWDRLADHQDEFLGRIDPGWAAPAW